MSAVLTITVNDDGSVEFHSPNGTPWGKEREATEAALDVIKARLAGAHRCPARPATGCKG